MDNGDKSKTNEAVLIPRQIYNQLILLAENKDFVKFIEKEREDFNKKPLVQAITQCKRNIQYFIQDKKLPQSWLLPIFTLIKDNKLDFPMDNSISLRVDDQELTHSNEDVLLISNKDGHLLGKQEISMVITGKVSIEHIIQFLKKNKKEIEFWQEAIGLPEYKNPNWKDVNLGLKIIHMKDEQGMTFAEIAGKFLENEDLIDKEQDYYGNESNIKDLYYRYKKRLSSIP